MKKYTFKEKFKYWFDKKMANGSKSMITMLATATLIIVLLIASLITFFGLKEDGGFFASFWDALATIINAWMPYSDEGDVAYIILTAIVAIAGLLFTSVLIGIVGSAIEEKITELRKGNSTILEEGHTVVLGFKQGEYELINQLVSSAQNTPTCIVVAEKMEKDELEDAIYDNVDIPKNVHIICRNVDICDPVALECCSIPECKSIIVNPIDDARTVKCILAVMSIFDELEQKPVKITTSISDDAYLLPHNYRVETGVTMLKTYDIIARIIAHSCTQPGLSDVYMETFNFDGSELYSVVLPETFGHSFGEIYCKMDQAVPIGIKHGNEINLNPYGDEIIQENDELIVFAKNRTSAKLSKTGIEYEEGKVKSPREKKSDSIVIIGYNDVFDTIIEELPERPTDIKLIDATEDEAKEAMNYASRREDINLTVHYINVDDTEEIEKIVKDCEHVVLLSNHAMDAEQSDIDSILLLMKVRDIKSRFNYQFTITAEMQKDENRRLIANENPTDFVVASNMSSMVLTQVALSPELYYAYKEILSNDGNDLYLKEAKELYCSRKPVSISKLRNMVFNYDYMLLGYIEVNGETRITHLNPDLDEIVTLKDEDNLILIGEY